MYIEASYYFWRIAADLIVNHQFEMLDISEERQEIWLEQQRKATSYVVRISHQSFNWANQIKQDQQKLNKQIQRVQKHVAGRKVVVFNVYITKYPPVDDWEGWLETRTISERKSCTVHTCYMDEQSRLKEIKKLYQQLSLLEPHFPTPSEAEMEQLIPYLKQSIKSSYQKRKKEKEQVFSYGKPMMTYLLIAINLFLFAYIEWNGASTDTLTLIEFGAKYNPAILDGEWWRILSSMFIHIGFLHITLNMLALHVLGTAVEKMFGSIRFLFIYFIGGIVGGLASFAFTPNVAAGASGAIYGLFGALLFFGVVYRKLFFQTIGSNVIFILLLNIGFSMIIPQVDNSAHLGGLIGGFLATSFVHFPHKREVARQVVSLIVVTILMIGLGWYGVQYSANHYNAKLQAQIGSTYVQEEAYEEAIQLVNDTLTHVTKEQEYLYFVRGNAYVGLSEYNRAKEDYIQAIRLSPDFLEAHQNLSIIYWNVDKDRERAIYHANKALEIDPANQDVQQIIQSIEKSG
ncbi:rhomboid family protein [Pontibacillus litoralis]|uniref:Peptidase S54 n=1 Tax=Pontibacillus litoralis JSM 072002 TaxID=1385512 RepID=A0A0A5GCF7_9BACI|nr:rhomboid family intramembrane serine protease [Pontibacillus litoralis]KGX88878.1 peptidase S54 [Pontibacillus litoralis JSM 072002]